MLYPTTSSSTDPTIRKAKKSPNFVAFNGLEQINILWAQCPSLVLKGSSWADTETLKESTETPKNKPCPQARTCPPQAFRHPPPAPPKTSQPSDLHWDPLVPQGSRRDLLGAWLLQHILQAGAGLGSFPCFSRQPALTATAVNSQCLHLPTLSSVYLSIIHPKFFHPPPLTPRKCAVMKFTLCCLTAPQITALPVLPSPFSISGTSPDPSRGVSQTLKPMLSGLWMDHTSGPRQALSWGASTRAWVYFAASNWAR